MKSYSVMGKYTWICQRFKKKNTYILQNRGQPAKKGERREGRKEEGRNMMAMLERRENGIK